MVRSLLSDVVERELDADPVRLWVIDGGKALRCAIVERFGATAIVQRCQEHKRCARHNDRVHSARPPRSPAGRERHPAARIILSRNFWPVLWWQRVVNIRRGVPHGKN